MPRYKTSYFGKQVTAVVFMMTEPQFTVTQVAVLADVSRSTAQEWFRILRNRKLITVCGRETRERQRGGILAYLYRWIGPVPPR